MVEEREEVKESPEEKERKSVIALLKTLERTLQGMKLETQNALNDISVKIDELKKILTSEEW